MRSLEEAGEVLGGTDEVPRRLVLKAFGAAGAASVAGCSGDESEGSDTPDTVSDNPTASPTASPPDTPSPTPSPTVSPTDTPSPTPSPTASPTDTASPVDEWDYGSPGVLNKIVEASGITQNYHIFGVNTNAWDTFAPDEELSYQVANFNSWMIPDWEDLKGFGEVPGAYVYVVENPDWDGFRQELDEFGFSLDRRYNGRGIFNGGDVHPGIDNSYDKNYVLIDESNSSIFITRFGSENNINDRFETFVDVADDRAPSYDEEGQPFHALSENRDYVLNSERSIGFMMMFDEVMPEFAVGGTSLNMNGNNYPVTMQVREDGQGVVMRQLVVSDDSVEVYDDQDHVYDDFSPMANTVDRNTYPGMMVWKD